MNITVAIVEDNNDIRQALEKIIEMADGYEIACTCVNGEDALVKLPIFLPEVVLMDINLGDISGIDVVRELKVVHPEMLFMMCTVYEEDEKIFEALNAGASGYIIKKMAPTKILESIKELHNGGAPMSSQIARKVVSAFQNKKTEVADNSLSLLSKRELEILEMLSTGLVYKEISEKLFISSETVRKHVYSVYDKLHVNNRVEAINKFFGR
ncbi:MAG: response regulator transcription factor [Bacteroidetes bacterium]|nr:response regulator transcription factor [Bacteroidota bacterium]MBS1756980.1 response regulator transcription factor [Bacteroidota bacterium]